MHAPRWWPRHGLWRHPGFLRLWSAQVVSAMGSRITRTALPVIAVMVLDASPGEVAVMMATVFLCGLGLGLVAGGRIDRGDKRAILVAADLVRAVAVASIPVAAWFDVLDLVHLTIVAGIVGAGSALFNITDNAYLPALIGKEQLAEGNAKLEATESVAEIVGPAAAGGLIRLLGAPLAVLIDAFSYLWSAAFLAGLPSGKSESPPPRGRLRDDLGAGLRAVWHDHEVRRLVGAWVLDHLAGGFFISLYMVFLLREVPVDEATAGVIIGFGGVGALIGALAAGRVAVALGVPATILVSMLISRVAVVLIPLATGGGAAAIALLIAHQVIGDGFMIVYVIHAMTVRQTRLPGPVLGRANAAVHVVTVAATLTGTLLGGVVGDLTSARTGLWVATIVGMTAPLLLAVTYRRGAPLDESRPQGTV